MFLKLIESAVPTSGITMFHTFFKKIFSIYKINYYINYLNITFSTWTGRGSGSFAGGLLIGTYGTREAFQIMALMGIISGTVYGIMHFFWLHKYDENYNKSPVESTGKFVIIYGWKKFDNLVWYVVELGLLLFFFKLDRIVFSYYCSIFIKYVYFLKSNIIFLGEMKPSYSNITMKALLEHALIILCSLCKTIVSCIICWKIIVLKNKKK